MPVSSDFYSDALKSDSKSISVVIALTILVILLQKDKEYRDFDSDGCVVGWGSKIGLKELL